jgi:hypothetical protein
MCCWTFVYDITSSNAIEYFQVCSGYHRSQFLTEIQNFRKSNLLKFRISIISYRLLMILLRIDSSNVTPCLHNVVYNILICE